MATKLIFTLRFLDIMLLRMAVAFTLLGIACYTDIKQRKAPNKLWEIMFMASILALFSDWLTGPVDLTCLAIDFALAVGSAIFFLFVWRLRLMGPADIKALITLQFLFLTQPFLSISVFAVSLVLCLFLFPLFVLAYNAVESPSELRKAPLKGLTNTWDAGEWKHATIPFMIFIFIGLAAVLIGGAHL
jgi:Flp pilus assembly protein protease CpaA